jgi:UDP-N-acetylmuramoyl-tripeptide--D-alanyl-D-alanine ligase
MTLAIVAICAVAAVVMAPRWLRVAQREHYIAPSVSRFAARWWSSTSLNLAIAVGATTSALSAFSLPAMAIVTAAVTVWAPVRLSLRGRSSKLAWTRRLKTLAVVAGLIDLALFTGAAVSGRAAPAMAAMLCFLQPVVIDVALALTQPFERRAARKFVRTATAKLRSVAPRTVAITGSYGKTTTKLYARHLIASSRSVLASPASFNNTGGLSRTLNEQLTPGTEVFIAEMGMYGPGEIRSMCSWVQPAIGVIVNIGPVHLERVHSIEGIVKAKREIVEHVEVAVLNVSAPGLEQVADEVEAAGTRVVRVATDETPARVRVTGQDDVLVVEIDGAPVHRIEGTTAQAANVAAALGIVLALDLPIVAALPRLDSLPQPEHRREVERNAKGVTVIDNTFSSNPASAAASLRLLDRLAGRGQVVVVTPGMVELGRLQYDENKRFATAADDVATDLVIVGQTNLRALRSGAEHRDLTVHLAADREQAVAWVRDTLTDGDVVLYENDLPDHYP